MSVFAHSVGEWFPCPSAGSPAKHHRQVLCTLERIAFFNCKMKGLLFWKIWTLEGRDLDLWVSRSVAWKKGRRREESCPASL